MPTDSGRDDSEESAQHSLRQEIEKTPQWRNSFDIVVRTIFILVAICGVILIVMSGQDPSIKQITEHGGNQNPFNAIANVVIGGAGIFKIIMNVIGGVILLAIARAGYRISRSLHKPNQEDDKIPLGEISLGIVVILIAICGLILIVMSGQDQSAKQITDFGGNTNPFVAILNVGIGGAGIVGFIGGMILLVIALGGYKIIRSPRPRRAVSKVLGVPVVLIVALWLSTFLHRPSSPSTEEVNVNGQPGLVTTEWHSKGQKKSETTYVNGMKEGVAREWYSTGEKESETTYVNGMKEGVAISWNKAGAALMETTYINDQPSVSKGWNGKPLCARSITTYVNGNGKRVETIWNHNNEPCSEANYVDGKLDGVTIEWHRNGQRSIEHNMVNGERDGVQTEWYENGQKKTESNIVKREKDGVQTEWYENGQKSVEEIFVNGQLDGVATMWYENGQKTAEGSYVNGRMEGTWIDWNDNGQKLFETTYVNGRGARVETE